MSTTHAPPLIAGTSGLRLGTMPSPARIPCKQLIGWARSLLARSNATPGSARSQAILGLVSLLLASFLGHAGAAEPILSLTSSRIGFVFHEGEAIDIQAVITDADSAVATYTVKESEGPWQATGTLDLRAGQPSAIPFTPPRRGLFRIDLAATTSAGVRLACETWLSVLFAPLPPDVASPWGINPYEGHAPTIRRIGASWVKLSGTTDRLSIAADGKEVTAEVTASLAAHRSYREAGLFIMSGINGIPRALSSRPDDEKAPKEHAPNWRLVKPRDYGQWDSYVESLVRQHQGLVDIWSVWNEPDYKVFWRGTPEEFAELCRHTTAAIRRADPTVKIAVASFSNEGEDFAGKVLDLGCGPFDILTFHHTDAISDGVEPWKRLLAARGLAVGLVNNEERQVVPLNNLAGGVTLNFFQLFYLKSYTKGHTGPAGAAARMLTRADRSLMPKGVLYSVAAHCLGTPTFVSRALLVDHVDNRRDWQLYQFTRAGSESVSVLERGTGSKDGYDLKPFPTMIGDGPELLLEGEVLVPGSPLRITDHYGRTSELPLADGKARLKLPSTMLFINGASRLRIQRAP